MANLRTKIKMKNKLPSTMHGLLSLAISDLKKVKEDKKYIINMNHFHKYKKSVDKCEVCMAGAVLAKTLKIDYKSMSNISDNIRSIDLMRIFNFVGAYKRIYNKNPLILTDKLIKLQHYYSTKVRKKMGNKPLRYPKRWKRIISKLKEIGV